MHIARQPLVPEGGHSRGPALWDDGRVGVLYVAVLDGQQRVLHALEHGLRLLHGGDGDVLLQEPDPADGADQHRRARAEHLQQLELNVHIHFFGTFTASTRNLNWSSREITNCSFFFQRW